MRVLVITADFPPIKSGEAAHAFHLATHMAERGVDVQVLTSRIRGVVTAPGITVHAVMPGWSWAALPRLTAFLARSAPDAVLLIFLGAMYGHEPMITFAPTLTKRVSRGVPFVTQFENTTMAVPSLRSRIVRKAVASCVTGRGTHYAYGTLLRDSDRVIALSETHRMTLANDDPTLDGKSVLIPPPPIMAVSGEPAATARERGRAALGVTADEFLLVYYGYLYPGKGIETLFHAVARVAASVPRVRLAVVGGFVEHASPTGDDHGAYARETRALPDALGIADRVLWTGPCPPEAELGSLYLRAADACVLPFNNGVHLNNSSFAAAATHGVPVITTRGAVLETQFVDGDNVLLCRPRDPDDMALAITRVIGDPALCQRLKSGAGRLAHEWFSWDTAVDRTLSTLTTDHPRHRRRRTDGAATAL